MQEAAVSGAAAHPGSIRIENLHYQYPAFDPRKPDETPPFTLAGVDLSIDAGEFVAVLGATSSGKSTLCLTLNGLAPQQTGGVIRGEVWVGDWNTKHTAVPLLATRIGLVFQDPEANLLGLTVEDEIAFGCENLAVEPGEIDERIDWSLDIVGMRDQRERMISSLSGGQKQRVGLAAVIAMLPAVIVLDEPLAELDPVGRVDVAGAIGLLRERRSDLTIVWATADADPIAELADRVVVLANGRVETAADADAVFRNAGRLLELGIAPPQIAELGLRLSAGPARFWRFDDAQATLRAELARASKR
jgi:energy-coupling factor transporter ATP-binding protein EcfA2